MTLNEAAVGERTVFAPGIVTLNDAAVFDVTFLNPVPPTAVTRNDAAVADKART